MRTSDWRVTWTPETGGAVTLVDWDDLLDREIVFRESRPSDIARPDFAAGGKPVARGGLLWRLEIARLAEHTSGPAAWAAMLAAAAIPSLWNRTATVTITPRGGAGVSYLGVMLSARHAPRTESGVWETRHEYSLRLTLG